MSDSDHASKHIHRDVCWRFRCDDSPEVWVVGTDFETAVAVCTNHARSLLRSSAWKPYTHPDGTLQSGDELNAESGGEEV